MDRRKRFATRMTVVARSPKKAMRGADTFMGASVAGGKPARCSSDGRAPLVIALANRIPEIRTGMALAARRMSCVCDRADPDHHNQVNNVRGFP